MPHVGNIESLGNVLEAQRLLEETVEIAKKIVGPKHSLVLAGEKSLVEAKRRRGMLISENKALDQKRCEVLKLTKDGQKYVIQFEEDGELKKVKAPVTKVYLGTDTPVSMGANIGKIRGIVKGEEGLHVVEFGGHEDVFPSFLFRVIFN